jgi:LytS/YehU family sensor histidine kinase
MQRNYRLPFKRIVLSNTLSALVAPVLALCFTNHPMLDSILRDFAVSFVFANVIGTAACLILPLLWPGVDRFRPAVTWIFVGLILLALATAGTLVSCLILTAVKVFPAAHFWEYFFESLKIAILITCTFGGISSLIETMRYRLENTTLQLRTKELENERALKMATEARLASLESRVHPHFLFNTLNSISALIVDNPRQAERMLERMAALLRFSLDSSHSGSVRLNDEIRIVTDYLEIEKTRFGNRLQFDIQIPDEIAELEIPPLTVQTLVENSVKFAVAPRREGGKITVKGSSVGNKLLLQVCDDGPGFTVDARLPGHGVDNLQSRLLTLYGMDAGLGFSRSEQGMVVSVSIPVGVRAATNS